MCLLRRTGYVVSGSPTSYGAVSYSEIALLDFSWEGTIAQDNFCKPPCSAPLHTYQRRDLSGFPPWLVLEWCWDDFWPVCRAQGSLLELISPEMFILVNPINSCWPGLIQLSSVTETSQLNFALAQQSLA